MGENDEIERIKRIRDSQISARDPRARLKKRDQRISAQLRAGNPYGVRDALTDIKAAWVWMTVLGVLGLLGGLLFASLVHAWWSPYVAIITTLLGGVIGRIIGQLIDRGRGGWTRMY